MKPALQSYIEGLVGGQFTVQNTTVTVSTSPTKLVDHNFERMALVMINTGSQVAQVLPAINPTTTNGITLSGSGGVVTMNAHDDLALVGWEWWAVSDAATTTFTIMEILRYASPPPAAG